MELVVNTPPEMREGDYIHIHKARIFCKIPKNPCPTSGGAVMRSKLVDGRCQVQTSVALVDRLEFSVVFSETRVNTG